MYVNRKELKIHFARIYMKNTTNQLYLHNTAQNNNF